MTHKDFEPHIVGGVSETEYGVSFVVHVNIMPLVGDTVSWHKRDMEVVSVEDESDDLVLVVLEGV